MKLLSTAFLLTTLTSTAFAQSGDARSEQMNASDRRRAFNCINYENDVLYRAQNIDSTSAAVNLRRPPQDFQYNDNGVYMVPSSPGQNIQKLYFFRGSQSCSVELPAYDASRPLQVAWVKVGTRYYKVAETSESRQSATGSSPRERTRSEAGSPSGTSPSGSAGRSEGSSPNGSSGSERGSLGSAGSVNRSSGSRMSPPQYQFWIADSVEVSTVDPSSRYTGAETALILTPNCSSDNYVNDISDAIQIAHGRYFEIVRDNKVETPTQRGFIEKGVAIARACANLGNAEFRRFQRSVVENGERVIAARATRSQSGPQGTSPAGSNSPSGQTANPPRRGK